MIKINIFGLLMKIFSILDRTDIEAGFIFKSKVEGYEANSIFFPAAGRKSDSKREFEKYNAFLWTSQNGRGYSLLDHEAKAMNFQVTGTENKVHTDARAYDRNTGLSIRPVNRPE